MLLGVTLWRLLVATCGFVGFSAAVADSSSFGSAIQALSQQASLLAGVVFLGLALFPLFTAGRTHEPRSPWWRGMMTVTLLLVGITFQTLLSGDLASPYSLFEHALTPLVVLVDFLVIGSNQARAKWWHPLTWVLPPMAYLVYFVIADVDLYGSFLDPGSSSFAATIIVFMVAVVAAGYALYGIGKLRARVAQRNRVTAPYPNGPAQYPYAPQQPAPQQWQYAQQPYPQQQPYGQPQVPQPQPPPPPQQQQYTQQHW